MLNCFITFDNKSFDIQKCGSGRLMEEEYEAEKLYHFGSRPHVSYVVALGPKMFT